MQGPRSIHSRFSSDTATIFEPLEGIDTLNALAAQPQCEVHPNPPHGTQEYVAAGGMRVMRMLQAAAELVPIPLLKDALSLTIRIIEVCDVSA